MQFHAGNRHFIAGAQQGAGGGKTFAAARTQVVHAQVDGSHTGKPLAQLFFVDGVMAGKGTADADQAAATSSAEAITPPCRMLCAQLPTIIG